MTKQMTAALLFLAGEFLRDAAELVRKDGRVDTACDHPEDQRKALTMGDTGMWECELCGHVEEPARGS